LYSFTPSKNLYTKIIQKKFCMAKFAIQAPYSVV
jgi:hypothetical protein